MILRGKNYIKTLYFIIGDWISPCCKEYHTIINQSCCRSPYNNFRLVLKIIPHYIKTLHQSSDLYLTSYLHSLHDETSYLHYLFYIFLLFFVIILYPWSQFSSNHRNIFTSTMITKIFIDQYSLSFLMHHEQDLI
jgi:hypothetical protein